MDVQRCTLRDSCVFDEFHSRNDFKISFIFYVSRVILAMLLTLLDSYFNDAFS